MSLIPGVENKQNEYLLLIKLDILSNHRSEANRLLSELSAKLKDLSITISFEKNVWVESPFARPTALFGFSARFFKGPLTNERDQNNYATRFGINLLVPPCLRQMNAREDNRFKELCSQELISQKESDVLILLEFAKRDSEIANLAISEINLLHSNKQINLKAIYQGFFPSNGIGALGANEGISNLQELRSSDPESYQKQIFVQNNSSDTQKYNGGSYVVFRKYLINDEYWFSDSFAIKGNNSKKYSADEARNMALGRSLKNNLVIDCQTQKYLSPEFDEKQSVNTFDESHIKHANPRRKGKTNFGTEVTVKDIRILRRSFSSKEIDYEGKSINSLLFLCFQNDIQKEGFEFIHNEWLMSQFLGGRDRLMDPESKIVEPVDGCYYFCPLFTKFPGDIFFNFDE